MEAEKTISDIFDRFLAFARPHHEFREQELDVLRAHAKVRRLRRGQSLLLPGDVAKYIAWVGSGCLRLYAVEGDSGERIVEFALGGQYIADRISILTGAPSPFVVDAVLDSEVLLFGLEDLEALRAAVPGFSRVILGAIEDVLSGYQTRVMMALSLPAADKYRWIQDHNPRLLELVPQKMIASYLGITPATLSRLRVK